MGVSSYPHSRHQSTALVPSIEEGGSIGYETTTMEHSKLALRDGAPCSWSLPGGRLLFLLSLISVEI